MLLNLKQLITLAVVTVAAFVGFLAIFEVRQFSPTESAKIHQPPQAVDPRADLDNSQTTPQDTIALDKTEASREVRGKNGRPSRAAVEGLGAFSKLNPTFPNDNTIAPDVPTVGVEDVSDSFASSSEIGDANDDQSAFVSSVVSEPAAMGESFSSLPRLPAEAAKSYVSPHLSGRTSTLLAEIATEGAALRLHAETLGTFAWNPRFGWQSHAFYLEKVKGHINAVGERITELQQIRHAVLPWQQRAISEVTSHAADVAAGAQAAIVHLRENQDRLFVSEYRDRLRTIANHSAEMKQTVDKFLEYEKAQREYKQLQNELEIAGD